MEKSVIGGKPVTVETFLFISVVLLFLFSLLYCIKLWHIFHQIKKKKNTYIACSGFYVKFQHASQRNNTKMKIVETRRNWFENMHVHMWEATNPTNPKPCREIRTHTCIKIMAKHTHIHIHVHLFLWWPIIVIMHALVPYPDLSHHKWMPSPHQIHLNVWGPTFWS